MKKLIDILNRNNNSNNKCLFYTKSHKKDYDFTKIEEKVSKDIELPHIIICLDQSLDGEKEFKKLLAFRKKILSMDVMVEFHFIDHHQSAYQWYRNSESLENLNNEIEFFSPQGDKPHLYMMNIWEYAKRFRLFINPSFILEDINESEAPFIYCHNESKNISAAKMVYHICRLIIQRFFPDSKSILRHSIFKKSSDVKKIINLVSDYDTGTYELQDSRNFIAGFYNKKYNLLLSGPDFSTEDSLKFDIEQTILEGKVWTKRNLKFVKKVLKNVHLIELAKIKLKDIIEPKHTKKVKKFCKERDIKFKSLKLVLFWVSASRYERLRTWIGSELNKMLSKYQLLPVTTICRKNSLVEGEVVVSFRSLDENFYCSKIAEIYGGGGHQKAASFRISSLKFKKTFVIKKHFLKDIFEYWEKVQDNLSVYKLRSRSFNMHLLLSANEHIWERKEINDGREVFKEFNVSIENYDCTDPNQREKKLRSKEVKDL